MKKYKKTRDNNLRRNVEKVVFLKKFLQTPDGESILESFSAQEFLEKKEEWVGELKKLQAERGRPDPSIQEQIERLEDLEVAARLIVSEKSA